MTHLKIGTQYCEYCLAVVSPHTTWQQYSCTRSESGSHRIRTAGECAYRVQLGEEIANPAVDDWKPISETAPDVPGSSGITVWSDWDFSRDAPAFRQIGGNSNGDKWERYYRAVSYDGPDDALPWPSHTIQ